MTDDLKPCPFCGEKNLVDSGGIVSCASVHCGGAAGRSAVWNTRPVEDKLRAEVEKLRAQLEHASPIRGDGVVSVVDGVPLYGGPVLLQGPLSMSRRDDGIVELSQYQYDEESGSFEFCTIGYVFDDETVGDTAEEADELRAELATLREALERIPTDEIADRLRASDRTAYLRSTLYEARDVLDKRQKDD